MTLHLFADAGNGIPLGAYLLQGVDDVVAGQIVEAVVDFDVAGLGMPVGVGGFLGDGFALRHSQIAVFAFCFISVINIHTHGISPWTKNPWYRIFQANAYSSSSCATVGRVL